MKKYLIVTIILIFPIFVLAKFNLEDWKYYKEIENFTKNQGLGIVNLDEETLIYSENDLADLRLIDEVDEEIPYILEDNNYSKEREINKINYIYPKLINNTSTPEKESSVVLEMPNKGVMVNSLIIESPTKNFQTKAKIYGSDEIGDWKLIKENSYIYNYYDSKGSVNEYDTTIDISNSVFKYYRLIIENSNEKAIKISQVKAAFIENKKKDIEIETAINYDIIENNEDQASDIIVEAKGEGLFINKFLIKTDSVNFSRDILLFASDDKDNWKFIKKGYIFNFDTPKFKGGKMYIEFRENVNKFYKISILNNDNQPINIDNLKSFRNEKKIIFTVDNHDNPRLFFGNSNIGIPQYDLQNYIDYYDFEKAEEFFLSDLNQNDNYKKAPVKKAPVLERIPYLLSVVLIFLSLGLIALSYFVFFRKDKI